MLGFLRQPNLRALVACGAAGILAGFLYKAVAIANGFIRRRINRAGAYRFHMPLGAPTPGVGIFCIKWGFLILFGTVP